MTGNHMLVFLGHSAKNGDILEDTGIGQQNRRSQVSPQA